MTLHPNIRGVVRDFAANAGGFAGAAIQRHTVLSATIALACGFLASTALAADDAAPQDIQIRPSISLDIEASDNIRRTATNQQNDVVLTPQASLLVSGETERLKVFLAGNLRYEEFLNESSLNRLTGNLLSDGTLTIVPGFFFLDGSAQISDEFIKATDQSPTGLPNGNPQTRVFNAQLSPYITTHLFDEADLTLRGRVAEVEFSQLDGPSSLSPSDSTIYSGGALLTNGERSRRIEWRLTADYSFENRDDGREFTSADGLLGLQVRATPKLSVIGRAGYEVVQDPTIPDIRDVVWAGGLSYQIGEASTATAERRHRYGRDAWYGDLNLALSSRFAVTGGYEERFENEQQRLSRSLNDLFGQSGSLPSLPTPVSLSEDLVDQSFFVKDARLGASYRWEHSDFDLSASIAEREFTTLNDQDRSAGVSTRFTQALPSDFRLNVGGSYTATLEPRIGQTKTENYSASAGFIYMMSESASARVNYIWSRTDGIATIDENLVTASISKSF